MVFFQKNKEVRKCKRKGRHHGPPVRAVEKEGDGWLFTSDSLNSQDKSSPPA